MSPLAKEVPTHVGIFLPRPRLMERRSIYIANRRMCLALNQASPLSKGKPLCRFRYTLISIVLPLTRVNSLASCRNARNAASQNQYHGWMDPSLTGRSDIGARENAEKIGSAVCFLIRLQRCWIELKNCSCQIAIEAAATTLPWLADCAKTTKCIFFFVKSGGSWISSNFACPSTIGP